ncbi:MAG: aldo/keto reductase, partial [Nitrospinota bacterium]|nr:aldo/keto reductase [Nitrospinota bacterium]
MSAPPEDAPASWTPGSATPEGTAAYRDRFAEATAEGHYRPYQDLWVSTIGIGTYLGDEDEPTDDLYRRTVAQCLDLGCNVIDTAANYRCQRSERSVGEGLRDAFDQGKARREEVVVTTKSGFIPFDGARPKSQDDFIGYIVNTFLKPGVIEKE